jgi:hypothetical protein
MGGGPFAKRMVEGNGRAAKVAHCPSTSLRLVPFPMLRTGRTRLPYPRKLAPSLAAAATTLSLIPVSTASV